MHVQCHHNRTSAINERQNVAHKWPRKCQLWTSSIVSNTVEAIERRFSESFHIILGSYLCNGIKTVCMWFDKQPKVAPNCSKKPILGIFNFPISGLMIRTKFLIVFLHLIRVLHVQCHQNLMPEIQETKPEVAHKFMNIHYELLQYFPKTSKWSNEVLQSFHIMSGVSFCYGINIE